MLDYFIFRPPNSKCLFIHILTKDLKKKKKFIPWKKVLAFTKRNQQKKKKKKKRQLIYVVVRWCVRRFSFHPQKKKKKKNYFRFHNHIKTSYWSSLCLPRRSFGTYFTCRLGFKQVYFYVLQPSLKFRIQSFFHAKSRTYTFLFLFSETGSGCKSIHNNDNNNKQKKKKKCRSLNKSMFLPPFVHLTRCRSSRREIDQQSKWFRHPTAKPSSSNLRWSISRVSHNSPRSGPSPNPCATRRSAPTCWWTSPSIAK